MTESRVPEGIFAPVATIFGPDGELDLAAYRENAEFYATSSIDGIVILGSNGEYPLLDIDERLRLIEAGVDAIAGRKIVMAGTGMESTRATIALTKRAAELGVDYALSLPCSLSGCCRRIPGPGHHLCHDGIHRG